TVRSSRGHRASRPRAGARASSSDRYPRARKRFGQHFLETVWAERVVQAIAPQADDTFVEIGPGRGAITRPLAARGARLVAVEIDRDLAGALRAEEITRLQVLEQDFLEITVEQLRAALEFEAADATVRAAGNLPYNVAAPILFKLIDLYEGGLPL